MNLNDPNLQPSTFEESGDNGSGDDAIMSLGVGEDFTEGDGLKLGGDGVEKPRVSSSALVLVAVIAIAVGGLFSMRTLTSATAANDTPSEAEQTIEMFLQVISGEAPGGESGIGSSLLNEPGQEQTVLNILDDSYLARQVSLTNVQRNPFIIFESAAASKDAGPSAPSGPDPREVKREETRTLFEQAGNRIVIRSILMGSTPLANVENRIVGIGDAVVVEPEMVTFRVTEIAVDSVTLVAEDKGLDVRVPVRVVLRRDSSSSPNRNAPPRRNNFRPRR